MSTFEQVSKDDKVSKSFEAKGENVVQVRASVSTERDGPMFRWDYTISFAECTDEEIREQAARNIHIRLQDRFRTAVKKSGITAVVKNNPQMWAHFEVRKLLDEERKSATPLDRAKSAVGKMTAAEKEELLELLQS